MKIYIVSRNPETKKSNPYVATLIQGINNQFSDIEWKFGFNFLWDTNLFDFDIIHFMWPHELIGPRSEKWVTIDLIENRLKELKKRNIKIVATCHNLVPHYSSNKDAIKCYDLVYQYADMIFHLGDFSLNLFRKEYPTARNILLPHQVYDQLYTEIYDKNKCLRYLNLKADKRYLLCFGEFRDNEERKLIVDLAKQLQSEKIEFIAPRFIPIPVRRNPILKIIPFIKLVHYKIKYPFIHTYGNFIPNNLIPYFYGASDLAFIQRLHILNSGNVPLGFLMAKVVVGPNTGNVGSLLNAIGNPTFDITKKDSIMVALKEGLKLAQMNKGENNRRYALTEFSTQRISYMMYNYYKELISCL